MNNNNDDKKNISDLYWRFWPFASDLMCLTEKRFDAWLTACVVFLLRCWYVCRTCQLDTGARRARGDFGTISRTLPKARLPPSAALRTTSWTGCARTTTVLFRSADRQQKQAEHRARGIITFYILDIGFPIFSTVRLQYTASSLKKHGQKKLFRHIVVNKW